MKKGQSHVDFAVSVGIFLVYLLLLFIFIKPGYYPEYQGQGLLKIVELNMKSDFYWDISTVPMFFDTNKVGYLPPVVATFYINDFPFNWDKRNIILKNYNGNEIPFQSVTTNNKIKISFEDNTQPFTKYVYTFLYSLNITKDHENPGGGEIHNITNATVFGVSEQLKGFNNNSLDYAVGNYNYYKDKWGYPNQKDFNIIIYSGQEVLYSIGPAQAPKTNIYVLRFSDVILYQNETAIPVEVSIKAW